MTRIVDKLGSAAYAILIPAAVAIAIPAHSKEWVERQLHRKILLALGFRFKTKMANLEFLPLPG